MLQTRILLYHLMERKCYLLTVYPNPKLSCSLIDYSNPTLPCSLLRVMSSVSRKYMMSCLITSPPILFQSTSTNTQTYHYQPLHLPLRHLCSSFSHVWTIQSHFLHLVHHGDYSHLSPYIFVPNLVSSNMPTRPSQHPHFCDLHLLDIQVLVWQPLHLVQHG